MSVPTLTPTQVDNIIKAVGMAAKFNWTDLYKALQSQSTEEKLKEAYLTAEEIASIVGIFIPVAAVVANDMAAVATIYTLIDELAKLAPKDKKKRSFTVFGHQFSLPF